MIFKKECYPRQMLSNDYVCTSFQKVDKMLWPCSLSQCHYVTLTCKNKLCLAQVFIIKEIRARSWDDLV